MRDKIIQTVSWLLVCEQILSANPSRRDALNKMKDVYEKNPQMGDPGSLQPKISETICNMEKLRSEIHKNEVISPVDRIVALVI